MQAIDRLSTPDGQVLLEDSTKGGCGFITNLRPRGACDPKFRHRSHAAAACCRIAHPQLAGPGPSDAEIVLM